MTFDVVRGQAANPTAARRLIQAADSLGLDEGTLYIGFPILASESGPAAVDALLCSKPYGLVAFDMSPSASGEEAEERRFDIRTALRARLMRNKSLVDRETANLSFDVRVLTFLPDDANGLGGACATPDTLKERLSRKTVALNNTIFRSLQSTIQSISTLRRAQRKVAAPPGSMKETLLKIQSEIANLDRWQKRAAIESPNGPQRIRGIAGSGKTIVLALKAAYLHATNPDWRIAVTFYTRSLYQQLRSLITQFHVEYAEAEPDWTRLHLLHSWGGRNTPGIYSLICQTHSVRPLDFNEARLRDADFPFRGICEALEREIPTFQEQFDAVLVDEAQDMPAAFLRLCYKSLREPKRLVWAYDELQNLSEAQIPSLADIFGSDDQGNPRVTLQASDGWASQDVILQTCYRNTPWALASAHSVGFGVYREGGLLQHFDEPALWRDIGYRCESGTLREGVEVRLTRSTDGTPPFFDTLLKPESSLDWRSFPTPELEAKWVAESIRSAIEIGKLEPSDILVVFPDARSLEKKSAPLRRILAEANIPSHIAGVGSSVDELFVPRSVAIAGIFRAKGNEAPFVHVMHADQAIQRQRLGAASKRNALFTAMTRSRAWLHVSGVGDDMDLLAKELVAVRSNNYALKFKIPTEKEREQLRRMYRDATPVEQETVERIVTTDIPGLLAALDRGEILVDDIPDEMREKLARLLKKDS